MQISNWGNSLAVRLPASLVKALDLKAGDEIELHMLGERAFEVTKPTIPQDKLARLRALRGRLPAGFRFDRVQANEA